ncbi:hypothetical protein CYMTET_31122 [Cymbomonas tetramitiformis]|uniref:Uncharacterized protein n=1 Tax=Cymbomonas tetramitiformis TaxID=36881 RepID=A0AAE0FHL3_9CHLO|nr:hypothetical protein CYMTET_31122 [Cymbomonas tetramitiformis]
MGGCGLRLEQRARRRPVGLWIAGKMGGCGLRLEERARRWPVGLWIAGKMGGCGLRLEEYCSAGGGRPGDTVEGGQAE